jgi:GNAT superfamily N-acetyltransferase
VTRIREVSGPALNRVNVLQAQILPSDVPFDTGTGWWWIADNESADVGFAGLVQSRQWNDAGYLCRAGVRHSARGKGLQKRLIQVRERKARAVGLRYLVTDTWNNPASANSLIACGFRMYLPRRPWAGEGALYWRKSITMVMETK